MNGDGGIDSLDIPPFVEALIDPRINGTCGVTQADLSGDGIANGLDLQLFTNAMLQS